MCRPARRRRQFFPAAQFRCRQKSPGARHAGLQDAPAPLKSLGAHRRLDEPHQGERRIIERHLDGRSTQQRRSGARAFALYQSQLEQQLLAGIGATRSASII
jgi:hypothetical protein